MMPEFIDFTKSLFPSIDHFVKYIGGGKKEEVVNIFESLNDRVDF